MRFGRDLRTEALVRDWLQILALPAAYYKLPLLAADLR